MQYLLVLYSVKLSFSKVMVEKGGRKKKIKRYLYLEVAECGNQEY